MRNMLFALLIAFLAVLAMGPFVIPLLRRMNFGSTERNFGMAASYKQKNGTPIMGGVMMMVALLIAALVFSPAESRWSVTLPALLLVLGFSFTGLLDDVIKGVFKRVDGFKPWQKIALQIMLSFAMALFCYKLPGVGSVIYVPFTQIQWDLGIFYIPFAMFVIIATTNSVNLLDGVDGLCSAVTTVAMLTLGLIALFMSAGGLAGESFGTAMVLSMATAGACMGFLRFNTYPAKVFMGDTGSFALGSAYVLTALLLRQPLLIVLTGVMYMVTSLSDIYQVFSIRFLHRRPLRMAPLHHHFTLKGMPESRVVAMYTLVTAVCCVLALLSLT